MITTRSSLTHSWITTAEKEVLSLFRFSNEAQRGEATNPGHTMSSGSQVSSFIQELCPGLHGCGCSPHL